MIPKVVVYLSEEKTVLKIILNDEIIFDSGIHSFEKGELIYQTMKRIQLASSNEAIDLVEREVLQKDFLVGKDRLTTEELQTINNIVFDIFGACPLLENYQNETWHIQINVSIPNTETITDWSDLLNKKLNCYSKINAECLKNLLNTEYHISFS